MIFTNDFSDFLEDGHSAHGYFCEKLKKTIRKNSRIQPFYHFCNKLKFRLTNESFEKSSEFILNIRDITRSISHRVIVVLVDFNL